jgi:DNA-binding CsgD family transcriptional regulator/N-acetylneuraminic acid mutarotase
MTDISELSGREREILHLVATGASNKEIAKELYISTNTVKVHLRNIFTKTGVNSRTEAAMYAVSAGLVEAVSSTGENGFTVISGDSDLKEIYSSETLSRNGSLQRFARNPWLIVFLFALAAALGATSLVLINRNGTRTSASDNSVLIDSASRWQERALLPTARSGLAVVAYENQIYAIGGKTSAGITNVLERYDPSNDKWINLSPKPTSVTDIDAAVIGGLIYVPGGQLTSGDPTNKLEVYNPREDQWEQRTSLPKAVSAYALTAFEGKLYLFGGWDGQEFVSDVFEYDPDTNLWLERSHMSFPRGYCGAAVSGGKIFVLGGFDGEDVLSVSEEYLPGPDSKSEDSWTQRAAMPEERYAMGVASVADIIYLIGGESDRNGRFPAMAYIPQTDEWQSLNVPSFELGMNLKTVSLGTEIYTIGGEKDQNPTGQNLAYQVMYKTSIPIIIK